MFEFHFPFLFTCLIFFFDNVEGKYWYILSIISKFNILSYRFCIILLSWFDLFDFLGNCFTQDNDYVDFHQHGYIADDYAVRGLKDFHINLIFSAEDCQLQCQLDPDCRYWVWNSPSYAHGNINTCWLKASNDKSRESLGKVSGPRNCSGKIPKNVY